MTRDLGPWLIIAFIIISMGHCPRGHWQPVIWARLIIINDDSSSSSQWSSASSQSSSSSSQWSSASWCGGRRRSVTRARLRLTSTRRQPDETVTGHRAPAERRRWDADDLSASKTYFPLGIRSLNVHIKLLKPYLMRGSGDLTGGKGAKIALPPYVLAQAMLYVSVLQIMKYSIWWTPYIGGWGWLRYIA